jgi:NAD-specific glutamate dehydrogenase
MIDWKELSTNSHYRTAVAVRDELEAGHVEEATRGIEELIDALSRSERRALKSQLVRLMAHVIKWRTQPDRRSWSWAATIADAREEIDEIREETPSLTEAVVRSIWDACLAKALRQAQAEMKQKPAVDSLDWREVFEVPCQIEDSSESP